MSDSVILFYRLINGSPLALRTLTALTFYARIDTAPQCCGVILIATGVRV